MIGTTTLKSGHRFSRVTRVYEHRNLTAQPTLPPSLPPRASSASSFLALSIGNRLVLTDLQERKRNYEFKKTNVVKATKEEGLT